MPLSKLYRDVEQIALFTALKKLIEDLRELEKSVKKGDTTPHVLDVFSLQKEYVECQVKRLELLTKNKKIPPPLKARIRTLERKESIAAFVKSFKALTKKKYQTVVTDCLKGARCSPTFLAKRPFQEVMELTRLDYADHLRIIKRLIDESGMKPEKVHMADVGCGIGNSSMWLASELPLRISAFDNKKEFREHANEAMEGLRKRLRGEVTFRVRDAAKSLPEKYDIVMCNHLLDRCIKAHRIVEKIVNSLEGPIQRVIVTTGYSSVKTEKERVIEEFNKYGFKVLDAEAHISLIYRFLNQHIFVFGRE